MVKCRKVVAGPPVAGRCPTDLAAARVEVPRASKAAMCSVIDSQSHGADRRTPDSLARPSVRDMSLPTRLGAARQQLIEQRQHGDLHQM